MDLFDEGAVYTDAGRLCHVLGNTAGNGSRGEEHGHHECGFALGTADDVVTVASGFGPVVVPGFAEIVETNFSRFVATDAFLRPLRLPVGAKHVQDFHAL